MQEQEKIETPKIMQTLIQGLNYEAWAKEIVLHYEEKGSKIAKIQGFLAGVQSYKDTIQESGYILDEEFNSTEKRLQLFFDDENLSDKLSKLQEICSDIDKMTSCENYTKFNGLWNKAVSIKKDSLFYFSGKGRDLHFAKGWYEAMNWVNTTIEMLQQELKLIEKKAIESLPF